MGIRFGWRWSGRLVGGSDQYALLLSGTIQRRAANQSSHRSGLRSQCLTSRLAMSRSRPALPPTFRYTFHPQLSIEM